MPQKLNQLVAVDKSVRAKREKEITAAYHTLQKAALFEGMIRAYEPYAEGGEMQPTEKTVVQQKVTDVLGDISGALTEIINLMVTRDSANTNAVADIEINGRVLAKDIPAVTLISLEKTFTDLHTELAAIPVLDPAEEWSYDQATGLQKTDIKKTIRTKKVARPIELAKASDKHPAQVQLVTEDVGVGNWNLQRISGAMPAPKKKELLARVAEVAKAIKYAREKANSVEAPPIDAAPALLQHIFLTAT
jgi:hypothetical protein